MLVKSLLSAQEVQILQVSKVTISSSSIELARNTFRSSERNRGGNLASMEEIQPSLVIGDPGSVPLSVENEKSGVSISPNPTSDFINVKIDKNKVLDRYLLLTCLELNFKPKLLVEL